MNRLTYGISVLIISGAVLLSSCSTNLGPETLPSTTPSTEPTETEPEVTTKQTTPESTEPASEALVTESIVERNGHITTKGTMLWSSKGEQVVLKGMSSYGIQDCMNFFTPEVVKTLAEDWGCDVLRISINGDADTGYLKEPEKYFDPVCKICDMCINQGIYVIVDWSVGYDKEAMENKAVAVDMFTRISAIYSDSPNLIYEIANDDSTPDEANPVKDEWTKVTVPFATDVIKAIRANSPKSLIIVDAPGNGLDIGAVVDSKTKLKFDNIAYSCRIFSGTHGEDQRTAIQKALKKGLCMFVSEWGLCSSDLKGGVYFLESDKWLEFLSENRVSWCIYAIGSKVNNDSNALNLISDKYTDEQKAGHWPDGLISKAGHYAREQILYGKVNTDTEETASTSESSSETAQTA
ncbi:MAG: cellulase family glycosylhydrolase [Clostridiales bacterium]|nr:cellulase family glycosylhydrolase [Clostridiales bacterium]